MLLTLALPFGCVGCSGGGSDETYDQMIQNYQHAFYENEALDGDSKESNKDKSYYALYKGSFKNFLIKCVVPNEFNKTVSTYAEAKDAVRAEELGFDFIGFFLSLNNLTRCLINNIAGIFINHNVFIGDFFSGVKILNLTGFIIYIV